MNRYGKRCVLYPRVSTEMQVDGYSLEGQKNMLTRFADREEMIVVDTYEDAGKSGKSIEGRPAFQKMLRDIEDGLDIDYILVYKLSRFGRNAADILNSLELVQSYGVNLICIEEGIDSSQTSGKLLISVLSAVAEIERENIIEQTMNGRREKARQGGWNGGFAPYGYTLEDNKLMIEETEAVAIRKIFELYTSSEIGLGGIANQLNLQGIRKIPRQNGTLEDWTGHFIKLILDNPVYCGKIAYGRRTKEKVKGTKNDYQMKRNDDYILTEGQHKGIVSEEVWEKAHAKRLRTGLHRGYTIAANHVICYGDKVRDILYKELESRNTNMNTTIRAMTPADKDSVMEMMRVFYNSPAVLSNGSDEIFARDIEGCISDNPYVEGYMFEQDGAVQGYGMAAKSFSTEYGRQCIWLEDIYIKAEYRGLGIGSQFIDYITKKYPDALLRLEVEEENARAVHVYKKSGFEFFEYKEMKKE